MHYQQRWAVFESDVSIKFTTEHITYKHSTQIEKQRKVGVSTLGGKESLIANFLLSETYNASEAFLFQLCKYGYKSLAELKETISSVQAAGIPLDIVYADIDHMNLYQDFTLGQARTALLSHRNEAGYSCS